MIITQTPLRVSFLGGGSDFPDHFMQHGGTVLATAIDRFAYVTVQDFNCELFSHRLRVACRKTEDANSPAEIEHPAIRACLEHLAITRGVELHHMADLPARTGLGSSSSFVVGMLQALHAYRGQFRSAEALASEAIHIERGVLAETGGYQDQVMAACGGTCVIRFSRTGRFHVTQLPLSTARIAELEAHMLLLYTGIERDSFRVLRRQAARISHNQETLCSLGALAERAAEWLAGNGDLRRFGAMLHDGWELKRLLSRVSLPLIDAAYEAGRHAGAVGGKLLGAGRGGFLLFIAEPKVHEKIRRALPRMPAVSVRINAPGSRVIFSDGLPDGHLRLAQVTAA